MSRVHLIKPSYCLLIYIFLVIIRPAHCIITRLHILFNKFLEQDVSLMASLDILSIIPCSALTTNIQATSCSASRLLWSSSLKAPLFSSSFYVTGAARRASKMLRLNQIIVNTSCLCRNVLVHNFYCSILSISSHLTWALNDELSFSSVLPIGGAIFWILLLL